MFAAALRGTGTTFAGSARLQPSRPGSPRWPWRRCSAPAAAAILPDSDEPAGTYEVKVIDAQFPTEQRLGQTSLLRIGVRNTGDETVPALDVTITIAGKEGETSLAAVRRSTTRSRTWRSRTGRSGCWPRRLPALGTAPPNPAAPTTSSRKTFAFGPLKPGETTKAVWKLSAVRAGQLHAPLQRRRRPRRQGQGGDRRRRRPGRLLRGRDHRRAAGNAKSPTAAKSSRSTNRQVERRRVACRRQLALRAAPGASPRSSRLWPALAGLRRRRARPRRQRTERRRPAPSGGVALKRIGNFDEPGLRRPAPPASRSSSSWSSRPGRIQVLQRRPAPRRPFLDISRPGRLRRRARACSRSPSRPTTRRAGASTSITPTTQGDIRIDEFRRRSADPGRRRLAPRGDRDPPPRQLQPQRRPAAVPRRPPLLRDRRRRLRRRPARTTPRTRTCLLGKLLRIDPRAARRPALLGARPATRSSAEPGRDEIYSYGLRNPFRFSFDTVTAGQPRIAIGDVGQNQLRGARLHDRRPRRAAPTSAGTPSRASPPTTTRTAAPPTPAAPSSRSSPTPTAAAAAARSSAATSSRDRAPAARCAGATSTPTSARASCAASSPT